MTDILIVEDEQAILESLEFILTRCGWSVGVARDGEAALQAALRFQPRLVLLDIMLPKRGGLDVLKILRSNAALASTPVLILTARGQQYDRQAAMDLKADGFITKPYANGEVVDAVRRILDSRPRPAASRAHA
ncbi:response regulator transcription factor [Mycoplana dimorpha]|uniref:Response regulator receiver domain-containing protein n=1 Tax=Mycoplana dimorpha TaxID=28320 RepID=A0A2T5BBA2_MYCDI|nr:response regulator [Mycoplana dimorpha]PTM96265.1 response regulator receiver domain-containing protein [Mycoplana dimorpha]